MNNNKNYCIGNDNRKARFSEEYILGAIIGRGTSSTVYKCLWKGRTEWACKIFDKKKLQKGPLQTEIPILLSLNHKNIVRLKQVFETEEHIQVVMELMRGGELFERIAEKGCYSERVAARALHDILKALQYLHHNGIVHRGIKPEKLLYETETDDSVIKISDLELIQLVPENSQLITTIGATSLGYCAPEVLLRQPYNNSVDIWSLGVVMYIMLCGCEPFWDSKGEAAVIRRIIDGNYTFFSPHWDTISMSAKHLIAQMLSLNPTDRPTASQILQHRWIQGETSLDVHMPETLLLLRNFNARRKFKMATTAVIALNFLSAGSPKTFRKYPVP